MENSDFIEWHFGLYDLFYGVSHGKPYVSKREATNEEKSIGIIEVMENSSSDILLKRFEYDLSPTDGILFRHAKFYTSKITNWQKNNLRCFVLFDATTGDCLLSDDSSIQMGIHGDDCDEIVYDFNPMDRIREIEKKYEVYELGIDMIMQSRKDELLKKVHNFFMFQKDSSDIIYEAAKNDIDYIEKYANL